MHAKSLPVKAQNMNNRIPGEKQESAQGAMPPEDGQLCNQTKIKKWNLQIPQSLAVPKMMIVPTEDNPRGGSV